MHFSVINFIIGEKILYENFVSILIPEYNNIKNYYQILIL